MLLKAKGIYRSTAVIRLRSAKGGWICSITILESMTLKPESCITRVFGKENCSLVVIIFTFQILIDHLKESDPLMEVTVFVTRERGRIDSLPDKGRRQHLFKSTRPY